MKLDKKQAIARRNQQLGGAVLGVNNCHFSELNRNRNIFWFNIPVTRLAVGQYEWVHLLLHTPATDELLHLKVPTVFLREKMEGLEVRNQGKRKAALSLELSADKDSYLQDMRPGAPIWISHRSGCNPPPMTVPTKTVSLQVIAQEKAPLRRGFCLTAILLLHTQLPEFLVTQLAPQDLAHVGRWQRVAELDGLGHLVASDVGTHVLHDLFLGQRGPRTDDDENLDRLA